MSAIVVGYDGSDSSKSALMQAAGLAKVLGDKLVLVFGAAPGGVGGGEVPEQRRAVGEHGRKVTAEGLETAKQARVEAEVELVNEHPDRALLTAGDRHDARMIVVGSHGENPLKGAIIGSTPYKLVQLSERPVLVVRA